MCCSLLVLKNPQVFLWGAGGQQVRGWGHLLSAPGSPQEVKNLKKKTSLLVLASFIASLNQYQISGLARQQVACPRSLPILSAGRAES